MHTVWLALHAHITDLTRFIAKLHKVDRNNPQWPRAPSLNTAAETVHRGWNANLGMGLVFPVPPSARSIRRYFTQWAKTGAFSLAKPGPDSEKYSFHCLEKKRGIKSQ